MRYPHTSYLCDEGDDPVLRPALRAPGRGARDPPAQGQRQGRQHQQRPAAGHGRDVRGARPRPRAHARLSGPGVPYFADPAVGYVQVVQAYGNQDESLVAWARPSRPTTSTAR